MVFSLLLVHSPLVGPSSLTRLADVATSLGHQVALPDLTSTVTTDSPHHEYVSTAAAAGDALPNLVSWSVTRAPGRSSRSSPKWPHRRR